MAAIPLTTPGRVPIFDGHNDVLLRLHRRGGEKTAGAFLDGEAKGHLDLPKARQGGFAGGLFAIFVPSTARPTSGNGSASSDTAFSDVPSPPAVEMTAAQAAVYGMVSLLLRIERESQGRVRVCRNVDDIRRSFAADVLASVLHIEGAEAIDPDFELLDVLHEAGLRSLGLVWSRPNAFGHGVPFLCPSSPDTGPGLTALGKELVGACNRLKILIDLSHLNEKGFWDVAGLELGPLVASHAGAHAVAAASRNLTDRQLDAIADSGGLVGIVFATVFTRPDFISDPDTPLATIAAHARYVADRIGVEHVALGSDFDGATVPAELGDVAGLPKLLDSFRDVGFSEDEIESIAWHNWRRVLDAWWR